MKKKWFKAKQYGWGWTPSSWEGWASIGVYILVIMLFVVRLPENASFAEILTQLILPSIVSTIAFLWLTYKTGGQPEWRWGNKKLNNREVLERFFLIFLPLISGVVGGFITTSALDTWYVGLNKPPFNPPNFVFGPVWTTLYLLMGFASVTIWFSKKSEVRTKAINTYFFQLILNFFWTLLFFGLQNPTLAFIDIMLLDIAVAATIFYFFKINKFAAVLLIPYLAWIVFASFLNLQIALLN